MRTDTDQQYLIGDPADNHWSPHTKCDASRTLFSQTAISLVVDAPELPTKLPSQTWNADASTTSSRPCSAESTAHSDFVRAEPSLL